MLSKWFTLMAESFSCKGGKSMSVTEDNLWKNNLYFVRDIPMVFVNFILIVVVICEQKSEALLSYCLL